MNKWNDIVIVLQACQAGNVLEKDYQPKIEEQFKLLGWSVYYGCIESKPKIETANTKIYPDIVLKKDGVRVLPVELKRPTNNLKEMNERQLFSYMRQLELRVGLYIGEKMQLYYNAPDDDQNPHPVLTATLTPDSDEGQLLCDLLTYDKFDSATLLDFCKQRLAKERYKQTIRKEIGEGIGEDAGETFVRKLLREHFIKTCVDEQILDEELGKVKAQLDYGKSKRKSTKKEKTSRRFPKYTLNGSRPLFKRQLALEAMRLYIDKHPKATYESIERLFNVKEMPGGYKVVRRLSDIMEGIEAGSLTGRFYTARTQILTSGDGVEFAVSNQWDYNNFPIFIEILRQLKWKVKEV